MRDEPYGDIQTKSIWVQMAMAIYWFFFCPITAAYASEVFEMILRGISLYKEKIPNNWVIVTDFFISRVRRTHET